MSKNDKFKQGFILFVYRVRKVLKLLKLIGNLANKTHYEYSSQDSKKIIQNFKCRIFFKIFRLNLLQKILGISTILNFD